MLKLGVNIDHVATLREARYRGRESGEPDPIEAALISESVGAHGITAHLREDRRHMQDRDIRKLREVIKTRLNLEMANTPEIISIALQVKPDIVCLVPERRAEVTTEGGLDVAGHWLALADVRKKFNDAGIEVSLFIAPDPSQIEAAARVGSQFIELHTGAFAENFHRKRERAGEIERLIAGATQAHQLGLQVNAGHGLNYRNLPALRQVPHLVELNIGHSIISRAVVVGLATAVREMLLAMEEIGNLEPHPDTLILGSGIDIIEVQRVEAAYEKFGDRFVQKILRPSELAYCLSHKSPGPFLAARFAGKEAISKAFGTGIGRHLGWHDMEICRKESGEPYVVLHGKGESLLRERGGRMVHLSLSHTTQHATAVAILESV